MVYSTYSDKWNVLAMDIPEEFSQYLTMDAQLGSLHSQFQLGSYTELLFRTLRSSGFICLQPE